MRRLTEAWFEFAGVKSSDMHVRLMQMPRRHIPGVKGEQLELPGRDGYLWQGENGARLPISIAVECSTEDGYTPEGATAWLQGEGLLRFSDEPGVAYLARIIREYARENMFLRFDRQRFSVQFECQPYRYAYPEAVAVALTEDGYVYNPGTAASLPRITIEGSGEMSVLIGAQQIDVDGGTVVIDSELMDCFDADGVTLANHRVTMQEFPRLQPGNSWMSMTGADRVMIEGRWRSL
jgi:phage-related protein